MRSYTNPFRVPYSERLREDRNFLRNFAVAMLDVLPDDPWSTPVIVRSPQGGGKTSLLRIFTSESLELISRAPTDYAPALSAKLHSLGAIENNRPRYLGVLLNLERDYRDLGDIDAPEELSQRLFFKLLDSRIIVAVIRASLEFCGLSFPEDIKRFELRPRKHGDAEDLVSRLGGPDGEALFGMARRNETELLDLLDSLVAVDWTDQRQGHADLYSLRVLSQTSLFVDNRALNLTPLILLDDGHFLARPQRDALLKRLAIRDLDVGRWYSERSEALTPQENLAMTGMEGRDRVLIDLSANIWVKSRARTRGLPYDKMASDVADARPARELDRYADEKDNFSELISAPESQLMGSRPGEVISLLQERLTTLAGRDARYSSWLEDVAGTEGYRGALARRELQILITRDRSRRQGELFEFPLNLGEMQKRSTSVVREAASLFMAKEYSLPYYVGPTTMVKLGSHNMAQFITLCADLFDEMLGSITLRHKPQVSAARQDAIVRRASERLWREIPQRLEEGRLVQRLLMHLAAMAQRETYRPNAPYAPGVTGIAISMHDRERLIKMNGKDSPGMADLRTALGAAIIDNMLTAEIDRWVKNQNVMVLYLNRLLCPRFRLPLGRGGFMVMKLSQLCGWMLDAEDIRPMPVEQLLL